MVGSSGELLEFKRLSGRARFGTDEVKFDGSENPADAINLGLSDFSSSEASADYQSDRRAEFSGRQGCAIKRWLFGVCLAPMSF